MVSASPDIGATAMKAGADDFVEKPFDLKYFHRHSLITFLDIP